MASTPTPPQTPAPVPTTPEKTPAQTFKVKFETSKGDIVLEIHGDWAPLGAGRFRQLVQEQYFDGCRFFRVLSGFMAQFGIHGDPQVAAKWRAKHLQDDPVIESNVRGTISFAMAGPNTRTTQMFINFANNAQLDRSAFSPIGKVIEGMSVVDALYAGYGEGAPQGRGPSQGRIQSQGNAYLAKEFPKLDYIKTAVILP